MAIILGLICLLALGIGAALFMAVLRWLLLMGLAVLCGLGAISSAIGAFIFFGLYQFFGPEYGVLIAAISIAAVLISAKLFFRAIVTELGIRRHQAPKEASHAR